MLCSCSDDEQDGIKGNDSSIELSRTCFTDVAEYEDFLSANSSAILVNPNFTLPEDEKDLSIIETFIKYTTTGAILNRNLEYQIGDTIYKYGKSGYTIYEIAKEKYAEALKYANNDEQTRKDTGKFSKTEEGKYIIEDGISLYYDGNPVIGMLASFLYGQENLPSMFSQPVKNNSNCLMDNGKAMVFCYPMESKETKSNGKAKKLSSNAAPTSGTRLKKTFYITAPKDGDYFFLANTLSTYLPSGQFQNIDVYINGQYQGHLDNQKGEWEMIGIYNKTAVSLKEGENEIDFISEPPFYPEVDAVEIAETESDLMRKAPSIAPPSKGEPAPAAYDWYSKGEDKGIVGNDKVTAYVHVPITYTYHRKITVQDEGKLTIHTGPVEGEDYNTIDPFMHLYSVDNPNKYSWYNDNSEGLYPKIEAKVPAGDYYLVIRAKTNYYSYQPRPSAGEINVYYDGAILNEKVPIAGFMISSPVNYKEALNYFTNASTGSPRIFLLDGDKMLFNSEPYTYYAPADYSWIDNTIKKIIHRATSKNWKMLITATGAWSAYYGSCDVYGGFKNAPSKYLDKFPNLKSNDAVLMAEDNSKYNSAAWAGGITDKKIWIGNSSLGSPYTWKSWDDYFANNPVRYTGAETYKPTSGNVKVIMYSRNGTDAGATHFAVTNKANNQLHGFGYESKIGDWGRITHTKQALEGTEYGNVYKTYYKEYTIPTMVTSENTTDNKVYTLEESIRDGLTVEKEVPLSEIQAEKLNVRKKISRYNTITPIEQLYNEWEEVIVSDSNSIDENPYKYLESEEAETLIEYCKLHTEECTTFLAEKIFSDVSEINIDILSLLFCEAMADKYAEKMENIKNNWKENPYTEDGAYIFPSCEYFTKLYIKEILDDIYSLQPLQNGKSEDAEKELAQVKEATLCFTENPVRSNGTDLKLNIPVASKVSLQITGGENGKTTDIINGILYDKGTYTIHLDASCLSRGMNICTLKIDNKKIVRKLLKK